jgi:hypothetical protein
MIYYFILILLMENISHNDIVNAEELYNWSSENNKLAITKSECPVNNYKLHDIRIKNRNSEDDIFLKDDEIFWFFSHLQRKIQKRREKSSSPVKNAFKEKLYACI